MNPLDDATYVASALERYAVEYRANVDSSFFLRARKVVVDYFLRQLQPGSRVLDMNCGTGIDVVTIAEDGHDVTGVDVSSAMVSFAVQNIADAGLSRTARAEVRDYRKLSRSDVPFDAVLSNFGGINFADDLEPVFGSIDGNLKDGGILLINSVSHFCFMESMIFLLSGKFSKAFRRLAGGKARIGGKWVRLFYHRKSAFVKTAARYSYSVVDVFGLNVFAPPLWAEDFFKSHAWLSRILEGIDNRVRRLPLFRTGGDFMVIVLKKGVDNR